MCTLVQPYEFIIAAETAHITFIEAGAIEATGRKIIYMPTAEDGKITTLDLDQFFDKMSGFHNIQIPRLLYISNTTELGGVYTKNELILLHLYCQQRNMLLYLDGARLASALAASNMTLKEIAENTDAFYIGATKAGGMLGEALIFSKAELQNGFEIIQKQRGATLAKGRFLGIQFVELFQNDLYRQIGNHVNQMAFIMAKEIRQAGFTFLSPPISNQIFPILPNNLIDPLVQHYDFYVWKKINNNNSALRLITSWLTKEENVRAFVKDLQSLSR